MKKLPIGIQNFREIIEGDYIYADKTQYIYKLVNSAKYYFLSRPRRFGKSLLLGTIGEAFNGDKDLFKGLWIYESDYSFEKHPVIRLDMSNISNENPEILKISIVSDLKKRIADEKLDITCEIPSDMFKFLIEGLCRKYGQKVVVLIDEYDKPILDHLHNVEMAEANRLVMRGFYEIDAVLELEDKVYVMEFKHSRCAADASAEGKARLFDEALADGIEQIRDRDYHKKYLGGGKAIYLAAFAFLGRDEIEMRMDMA